MKCIRFDNRVENLAWVDFRENAIHAIKTGLQPISKGKAVIQCDDDWNEINKFDTLKQASEETGAPVNSITFVCNGKRQHSGGYRWKWAK